MTTLSRNLKKFRVQNKLKQREVAELINSTQRTYSGYETGDREPDVATLIKLAELFKVPLDILVGRYVENNSENNTINQMTVNAIGRTINQTFSQTIG